LDVTVIGATDKRRVNTGHIIAPVCKCCSPSAV